MHARASLDQQLFRRGQPKPPPLPADFGRYQTRFDAADTEWLIAEALRRGLSVQQVIREWVARARAGDCSPPLMAPEVPKEP